MGRTDSCIHGNVFFSTTYTGVHKEESLKPHPSFVTYWKYKFVD